MPEPKPRDGMAAKAKKGKKGGGPAQTAAADSEAAAVAGRPERFPKRDLNGDGMLDHDEFMKTMSGADRTAGEARFKKMDADGDGRLTKEEFLGTAGRKP